MGQSSSKMRTEDLRSSIKKLSADLDNSHARIALIGPSGAGKSSFINTVISSVEGKKINAVSTSKGYEASMKVLEYPIVIDGSLTNVCLLDSRGFWKNVSVAYADGMISGQMETHEIVKNAKEDNEDGSEHTLYDLLKDNAAAYVLFVVDVQTIDLMGDDTDPQIVPHRTVKENKRKLLEIRKHVTQSGIPSGLLLTFIDKFKEKEIKDKKTKISNMLLIDNVFPVTNLMESKDLDPANIVNVLEILEEILQSVCYTMKNREREKKEKQKISNKKE